MAGRVRQQDVEDLHDLVATGQHSLTRTCPRDLMPGHPPGEDHRLDHLVQVERLGRLRHLTVHGCDQPLQPGDLGVEHPLDPKTPLAAEGQRIAFQRMDRPGHAGQAGAKLVELVLVVRHGLHRGEGGHRRVVTQQDLVPLAETRACAQHAHALPRRIPPAGGHEDRMRHPPDDTPRAKVPQPC